MLSKCLASACVAAILIGAPPPVMAQSSTTAPVNAADVRLRTLPTHVYFTTHNAKEGLDGSVFFLILEQVADASPLHRSLELLYRKNGVVVHSELLAARHLDAIDATDLSPTRLYPPAEASTIRWPHAYRLFLSAPAELGADSVEARLTFETNGKRRTSSVVVPIHRYRQRTSLIFPFKGKGIISAAGVLESGHRNRSGMYAIDALGLNPTYGPMVQSNRDEDPTNYAGWGREIIAPAAGTIVVAKGDHVDQPIADKSDPAYYLPQYPNGGDPGNFVVIDHGNDEFSMIAHMQKGTVRVKAGDRVVQGQVLGLMGNSGDTSGPHVHYQLQNGPDWEHSDALPFKFTNVGSITRGSFFEAK